MASARTGIGSRCRRRAPFDVLEEGEPGAATAHFARVSGHGEGGPIFTYMGAYKMEGRLDEYQASKA